MLDIEKSLPEVSGADVWRDMEERYGYPEALRSCSAYLETQLRVKNSLEDKRFNRELFAAMYEGTARTADPAKLVYPYPYEEAERRFRFRSMSKASGAMRNAAAPLMPPSTPHGTNNICITSTSPR